MSLTIHCVRCRKDTRAEKVGLREAVVLVRQGRPAKEARSGRRVLYWNRCTECGYLYSAPPPLPS